jgi:hypothetical protein
MCKNVDEKRAGTCSWCSLKNISLLRVGSVIPSHRPSAGMPGDVSSACFTMHRINSHRTSFHARDKKT